MDTNKALIRQKILEQRRNLNPDWVTAMSAVIHRRLIESSLYQESQSIFAYLDFQQEVETRALLDRAHKDQKKVGVPKVVGDNIVAVKYSGGERLEPGKYGILVPEQGENFQFDSDTLIIVPGLAFDGFGNRLGFGKGYYDRFLANKTTQPKIAFAFDFQLVREIRVSFHDIPVDYIVTEKQWFKVERK